MEAFNIEDQVGRARRGCTTRKCRPARSGLGMRAGLDVAGAACEASMRGVAHTGGGGSDPGSDPARSSCVQAAILARSTQLSAQHREYLARHPALTELMHDFLTNVLVNKPDDCYQFCQVEGEQAKMQRASARARCTLQTWSRISLRLPRPYVYTRICTHTRTDTHGHAHKHLHPCTHARSEPCRCAGVLPGVRRRRWHRGRAGGLGLQQVPRTLDRGTLWRYTITESACARASKRERKTEREREGERQKGTHTHTHTHTVCVCVMCEYAVH